MIRRGQPRTMRCGWGWRKVLDVTCVCGHWLQLHGGGIPGGSSGSVSVRNWGQRARAVRPIVERVLVKICVFVLPVLQGQVHHRKGARTFIGLFILSLWLHWSVSVSNPTLSQSSYMRKDSTNSSFEISRAARSCSSTVNSDGSLLGSRTFDSSWSAGSAEATLTSRERPALEVAQGI